MTTIVERHGSRPSTASDEPQVDLLFTVFGSDDDLVIKADLAAYAPTTYDGLRRESIQIEQLAGGVWLGTVHYAKEDNPESEFAFETGGGTQHITHAQETIAKYPNEAPDHKGAIGVTRDGVEGVDIFFPAYNFSEVHHFDDVLVTPAYKAALFQLTANVNSVGFKGFAAGEVLFLGASGSKRGSEPWAITFRFAASENRTDLMVGDIGPITKKGWEYLWVQYEDAVDDDAKALVKRPLAVYVERVYDEASFGGLGIGT